MNKLLKIICVGVMLSAPVNADIYSALGVEDDDQVEQYINQLP